MSTYYAVIRQRERVRDLIEELTRAEVSPDDLSLIQRTTGTNGEKGLTLNGNGGRASDATSFVGRDDDPDRDELLPTGPEVTERTTFSASPISGIDTSRTETNVDSIDQADDSQALAEDANDPYRGISHSEHERDDLEMAIHEGFATPVPVIDDIQDADTPMQEQMTGGVDVLDLPGFGRIVGGGHVATAALGFAAKSGPESKQEMHRHLVEHGVKEDLANTLVNAVMRGDLLLAVEVNPGEINASLLEQIVARYEPFLAELVDAPRFNNFDRAELL